MHGDNQPPAVWPKAGARQLIQESDRGSAIAKAAFKEYYFKTKQIEEPARIGQREFGYSLFDHRGYIRHLSFQSMGALAAMLVKEVPSDVYCSNGYYRYPTNPMQEKEWLGAELIFDIDAKDLDLPCVPSHSYSRCTACGAVADPAEGVTADSSCSHCGSSKAEAVSIPCPKCVQGAKSELKKLLSFLTEDLGIEAGLIRTYFSGNNGFHIHVAESAFSSLDSSGRSEIAGYVSGIGFMPESLGVRKASDRGDALVKFPRGGIAHGWRSKMASRYKVDPGSSLRLHNIVVQAGGYAAFKQDLEKSARRTGVRIDSQVTTDVHRIFRLPGTLNSKSGLAKMHFTDIDSFDPFVQACVLGDSPVAVKLRGHAKFRLKGRPFNLSKETAELPAYAAVFLLCKGLAVGC